MSTSDAKRGQGPTFVALEVGRTTVSGKTERLATLAKGLCGWNCRALRAENP